MNVSAIASAQPQAVHQPPPLPAPPIAKPAGADVGHGRPGPKTADSSKPGGGRLNIVA